MRKGRRKASFLSFLVLRFYRPLCCSYALRGPYLSFSVFTGISLFVRASGGTIFRCTAKDSGERRVKGAAAPLNPPGVNGDLRGDVLALLRIRIGAIDAIRPVRGVWQAHCFHGLMLTAGAVEWEALTQPTGSLRTSAHTGVAIRIPLGTNCEVHKTLRRTDCHVAQVLLAMTSENRKQYRNLGSAARRGKGISEARSRLNRVGNVVAER